MEQCRLLFLSCGNGAINSWRRKFLRNKSKSFCRNKKQFFDISQVILSFWNLCLTKYWDFWQHFELFVDVKPGLKRSQSGFAGKRSRCRQSGSRDRRATGSANALRSGSDHGQFPDAKKFDENWRAQLWRGDGPESRQSSPKSIPVLHRLDPDPVADVSGTDRYIILFY